MNAILNSRYERAHEAMRAHGIDAWVITGRETSILGEPALLHLMPAELMGRTTLILTRDGGRAAIVSYIESEELAASELFTEVIVYPNLDEYEPMVAEALKRGPLKRIAIDTSVSDPSSDGLTHTQFLMLSRCLEAAGFQGELVSSAPIMKCVRGKKSDLEVEKIAHTVAEAMKIFEEARLRMRLCMSGMDVQRLFQSIIDRKGYGYSWHRGGNPYVSVGARSSYNCKTPPSDVYIQPGDLVNVDLGVRIDGFASDNQRSFYALHEGETQPPDEVQRAFKTIQRMNWEVCAAMKVGVHSDDLTAIGNRIMLECGYEQGWKFGYGHELGLFAHNGGIKAGYSPAMPELDKTLEKNMTFTLEPAILTSFGRLCQEEVVCVGEAGGRMLSLPQDEIWLIQEV